MSRLPLLALALLPHCGSRADSIDDESSLVSTDVAADAGADARVNEPPAPDMLCCELRNTRGERLNYMCSSAIDTAWAESRGYRCWSVPAPE